MGVARSVAEQAFLASLESIITPKALFACFDHPFATRSPPQQAGARQPLLIPLLLAPSLTRRKLQAPGQGLTSLRRSSIRCFGPSRASIRSTEHSARCVSFTFPSLLTPLPSLMMFFLRFP